MNESRMDNDQNKHKASRTPVALFVYNRPWHTRQTVESLLLNTLAAETDVIIFSDGAKMDDDQAQVNEVRDYVRQIVGFKSVVIRESKTNKGLAQSIINGVTEVLSAFPSTIVLEDDMQTSPYFLQYMNDGLARYASNENVISVHAYIFPVRANLPETYFMRTAHCWGWGTWRRGWKLFEPDGKILLAEINARGLSYEFDYDGMYPFTKMLADQIEGRNNSWAIRWQASAYLKNKLTLYPTTSLLQNIGFDDSGTHSVSKDKVYQVTVSDRPIQVGEIEVIESKEARRAMVQFYKRIRPAFVRRIWGAFKMAVIRKLKS